MIRVSTLLKPETLEKVQNEANEKSISVAAIIRQKLENSFTDKGQILFMGVPIMDIIANPSHELYNDYKSFAKQFENGKMEKSKYQNKLDKSVNKDKAQKPKPKPEVKPIPKEYIDKHED